MPVTAEAFLRDAQSKNKPEPLPVYAVIGEEDYQRDRVVEGILALVSEWHGEPDVVRLDGDQLQITGLLDELRARTLFGGQRVIIVRDSGKKRGGFVDPNRDKLDEYCKDPAKGAHLVLVAPTLNKSVRMSKTLDKAKARIDCGTLKPDQLARWVGRRAKELRLEMSPQIEDHFISCAGDKMGQLANELEKLDLFLGDSGTVRTVTVAMLDDVLGFRGATTSFELLDKIVAGDLANALTDTRILLEHGESTFALTGLMAWRLKQFWKAAGRISQGASVQSAAGAVKMPPFQRAAFTAALKAFDLDTCRAIHDELIDADRKVSEMKPEQEFEFFVIRVCRRLDRARRRRA